MCLSSHFCRTMSSLLRLRCVFGSRSTPDPASIVAARALRTKALAPTSKNSSSSSRPHPMHKAASYPSWKPGDAVVFAATSANSKTCRSHSVPPLSESTAVAMQQKTLDATWSKSPWQPGMPVEILQPKRGNNNSKKRDVKAKKEESSSQYVLSDSQGLWWMLNSSTDPAWRLSGPPPRSDRTGRLLRPSRGRLARADAYA